MAMIYRTIHTKFWTDPKIKGLDCKEKVLFIYLFTCPHSHVSGIYYMPLSTASHETGLKPQEITRCLSVLQRFNIVFYDEMLEIVWVRHMLKYQYNKHSLKILQSVASQLENLHSSSLIKSFLEEYQLLKIPYTISHEIPHSIPHEIPYPELVEQSVKGLGTRTGTEKELEQEKEKDSKEKEKPGRPFLSMPEFEEDPKKIQDRKNVLLEQAKKLGVKL